MQNKEGNNILSHPDKSQCCGCTACYAVCPEHAISMQPDKKGFLYPQVNNEKCINCGLCIKVCDFKIFHPVSGITDFYAVRQKDENEVALSQSGGFSFALADYILQQNGVVFGCEMLDAQTVIHKAEITREGLYRFRGSKYVQSDMGDCFAQCADYLRSGRVVLFSGTACQVHGLLSFLSQKKVPIEHLVTADLVCHGVPSPKLWKEYIDQWNERSNSKIVKVNFRDKNLFGWASHRESFLHEDSTTTTTNWTNTFYSHVMFRESCHVCPYTTPDRKTDFTLADYWGIAKNAPEFDDDKGVNLLMIHTEKGRMIFEELSSVLDYERTVRETSLQPNLIHPSDKGKGYDRFWKDYAVLPREKFYNKYFFPSKLKVGLMAVKKKINRCVWLPVRAIRKLWRLLCNE